jgi:hypothetical protein
MSLLMSVLNSTAAATTPASPLAACQCSTDKVSSGRWFREYGRLDIQKEDDCLYGVYERGTLRGYLRYSGRCFLWQVEEAVQAAAHCSMS